MDTLRERLWIWGHIAGSHNGVYKCVEGSIMSPLEGAMYLGARNMFMISYRGKPQPPFEQYSKGLESLKQVKYSIVGDSSSPDKTENLGDLEEIILQSQLHSNITGGIFDDFFSERRTKLYTPEVLNKIHTRLNSAPKKLDMWSVLYDYQLKSPMEDILKEFDGVSFWTWNQSELSNFEDNYAKFLSITPNKRRMLGCYLYDYGGDKEMDISAVDYQLNRYLKCLQNNEAEGIIFCSNTILDLGFSAVEYAKKWIEKNGDILIND